MDQNWSNTILSFMVILSRLFTCPYIKIIYILLWDGVLSLSPKACFLPDSQQFYFSFLGVSLLHSVCFSHVLSQLVLMEEGRQSKYYTAWQMRKPRLSKKWFALLTQLEDIKDREFEPKTTCLMLSSHRFHMAWVQKSLLNYLLAQWDEKLLLTLVFLLLVHFYEKE